MVSWTDCHGVQSFLPVGSAIVRDDEIFSHPANGRRTGQLWIGDWIPMDGSWGVPRCLSPIIYFKPGTACGRGLVSLHHLWVNQGASKDSTVQGWELKLYWFFCFRFNYKRYSKLLYQMAESLKTIGICFREACGANLITKIRIGWVEWNFTNRNMQKCSINWHR